MAPLSHAPTSRSAIALGGLLLVALVAALFVAARPERLTLQAMASPVSVGQGQQLAAAVEALGEVSAAARDAATSAASAADAAAAAAKEAASAAAAARDAARSGAAAGEATKDVAQPGKVAATKGSAAATKGSAAGGAKDGAAPASGAAAWASRELLENTAWDRNASSMLAAWRSNLFLRMAQQYQQMGGGAVHDRTEPPEFTRYDLFLPVLQCPAEGGGMRRLGGSGDGGKWLCMADRLKDKPGCIIYSIGSNGNYDFEVAMLEATACDVHTFDCTYDGQAQHPTRHFYHKICVGGKTEVRPSDKGPMQFKTLEALIEESGHEAVDLLKVDIEGYEYELVSGLRWPGSCRYPRQIAMEVHYNGLYTMMGSIGAGSVNLEKQAARGMWPMHDEMSLADLVVFFGHLADLGYAIYSKEDNPYSSRGCCVEFSMIRVERPAGCAQDA